MLHLYLVLRYGADTTTQKGKDMKKEKRSKVIHCRVTEEEHATITAKAKKAGQTLTKYVIQSALCDDDGL